MDNYNFDKEFDSNMESLKKSIVNRQPKKNKSTMGDMVKKMNLNRWDVLGKQD